MILELDGLQYIVFETPEIEDIVSEHYDFIPGELTASQNDWVLNVAGIEDFAYGKLIMKLDDFARKVNLDHDDIETYYGADAYNKIKMTNMIPCMSLGGALVFYAPRVEIMCDVKRIKLKAYENIVAPARISTAYGAYDSNTAEFNTWVYIDDLDMPFHFRSIASAIDIKDRGVNFNIPGLDNLDIVVRASHGKFKAVEIKFMHCEDRKENGNYARYIATKNPNGATIIKPEDISKLGKRFKI